MSIAIIPEQDQLVEVRKRQYIVTDVSQSTWPVSPLDLTRTGPQHLVSLASIEDDALGEAPEVSPQSVALALLAAANVEETHRCNEAIDLVWTGPDSHVIPLRRTDQALLQLINEATTS